MSNEVIKILDKLSEKFGIAVDWGAENVIPYVKELCAKLVDYNMYSSIVAIVISILFLIVIIVAYVLILKRVDWGKYNKRTYYEWSTKGCFICGGTATIICCSLISSAILFSKIVSIIKCLTIPEMIIIEELKKLM
ncbi:MAG: hypothetical protein K2F81_07695 [Ruminococcus sp.]|nr:hypothetical protein [Ruminococcus sp.]